MGIVNGSEGALRVREMEFWKRLERKSERERTINKRIRQITVIQTGFRDKVSRGIYAEGMGHK